MTARQERELLLKLRSALDRNPPDHVSLKKILIEWKSFDFDTEFDDYFRAEDIVARFDRGSEQMLQLIKQVRSLQFLTEYTSSVESGKLRINTMTDVEDFNCFIELCKLLEAWPFAMDDCIVEGAYADAYRILGEHADVVRAAFSARDERTLRILWSWNGSGQALRFCNRSRIWHQEQTLSRDVATWLDQRNKVLAAQRISINSGTIPDELDVSSLQCRLLLAGSAKSSSVIPLIDAELFKWVKMFEESVLINRVKVLSLTEPVAVLLQHFEVAVQFGTTIFLTDFTGHLPPEFLPAMEWQQWSAGSLHVVTVGEHTVEFSPNFRRYLVQDPPELQLLPIMEQKLERFTLARRILQIFPEIDKDGTMTVALIALDGTQITRLQVPCLRISIADLIGQIAQTSGLDPLGLVLVFPDGTHSSSFSSGTTLEKFMSEKIENM